MYVQTNLGQKISPCIQEQTFKVGQEDYCCSCANIMAPCKISKRIKTAKHIFHFRRHSNMYIWITYHSRHVSVSWYHPCGFNPIIIIMIPATDPLNPFFHVNHATQHKAVIPEFFPLIQSSFISVQFLSFLNHFVLNHHFQL